MPNPNPPQDHNPAPDPQAPEVPDHQTISSTSGGYQSPYSRWHTRTSLAKPEELNSIPDSAYPAELPERVSPGATPWKTRTSEEKGTG